ncbi:MAG: Rrf2 family transcriptional regulator [Synergistaceae bacterium]|nr:Rrf2 family transcriptional regulator [Synergistaceae bacterium]
MKLSTVTRYGLRALSDLCAQEELQLEELQQGGLQQGELQSENRSGIQSASKPVAVSDIARRQDIPPSYLEQLFAKLRRGNLVKSVRGAQGGYVLARPAREITVAEVIRALGEPIAFGDCQTETGCRNTAECPTYELWQRLKGSVDDILESTTLEDIARKEKKIPSQKDFFNS